MLNLFTTSHWLNARDEYLAKARECRDLLMTKRGYAKNDPRLIRAVDFWIHRARNAHSFAMGRKPVIANAIVINNGVEVSGSLYAGAL